MNKNQEKNKWFVCAFFLSLSVFIADDRNKKVAEGESDIRNNTLWSLIYKYYILFKCFVFVFLSLYSILRFVCLVFASFMHPVDRLLPYGLFGFPFRESYLYCV